MPGIQQVILIADKVKDRVRLPEDLQIPVFKEDDVLESAIRLVGQRGKRNLWALFFLPLEEVAMVNSFFKDFKKTEVAHVSVAFSGKMELPHNSPLLASILDLRGSAISELESRFLIDRAFRDMEQQKLDAGEETRKQITVIDTYHDLESLIDIGKSLTLEKDSDRLLRQILYLSKKITGADAGSIYITEKDGQGVKRLRFKYSHTFSKELAYEEFTMPFDESSIAGHVALSGQVLNIADVYDLEEDAPVSFNRSFDQTHNYRTKSMLVVPMRNHLDQVIGVIQLINCKETGEKYTGNEAYELLLKEPQDFEQGVVPFDSRYENLMQAVASQAAIALENNRMILQIERQFDEFVKASVTAIESHDPATSGHSFRVAAMCVNMAHIINLQKSGPLAEVQFSETQIKELEMAGLLHDFGKVYIDPGIFLKGEKLYPHDFVHLKLRLSYLYRSMELCYARELLALKSQPETTVREKIDRLQKDGEAKLEALREIMVLVTELNKPSILNEDRNVLIQGILSQAPGLECEDLEGSHIPLLKREEIENFRIARGTLNREERRIIESHVEHTYAFVSKIPWPVEYQQIPEIARKHHEKLDGSGYPDKIQGRDNIPIQSRIMTIADIYDALAAADRPYKKAMELKRVFAILREEAAENKLDGELLELFISEKAYTTGKVESLRCS